VLKWLLESIERRRSAIQSERARRAQLWRELGGRPAGPLLKVDPPPTRNGLKEPDYRAWQSEFEKAMRGHLSR